MIARETRAAIDVALAACGIEIEPDAALDSLPGGDINEAARVPVAGGGELFVKHNDAAPPGMFDAEADGLRWLADAGALIVPEVIAVGDGFLVLEMLDHRGRERDFDEQLGRGLAALHRAGADGFGYPRDNFIALLPQANAPCPTWADFWFERRVDPLIALAAERRQVPRSSWAGLAEAIRVSMPELVEDEPPARLHGDLWSGNVIASRGAPAIIDPAVYGGHREVDLAMLALFGGLSERTASAYDEVYPLAAGWRDRVALWQVYPLLVHTVLFGGGYAAQAEAALRRYA